MLYPIPTTSSSTISKSSHDVYVRSSHPRLPTHCDDLGDHHAKAISTDYVGFLDSNEDWVTLFCDKCTNATLVEVYFTVILASTSPPLGTPIRCLSLCSASIALQLVIPNPTSTLPDRPHRCPKPVLLQLKPIPGRHRLVPTVPSESHPFPWLPTRHRRRSGYAGFHSR